VARRGGSGGRGFVTSYAFATRPPDSEVFVLDGFSVAD
jgi:hypothetical protein